MTDRDPLWANASAGAPAYAADELRRAFGMLLTKGVTDRFGARSGVHPAGSDAVTLAGTTWTLADLNAVVYPGLNSIDGPYLVQIPSESGSLSAPDGTNPRIDGLDLQVQDSDVDASGFRRARVVYVAGTPAPSPAAPAVSATSMRLGTFLVPQSGGGAASLTYSAPYTVAAGGILPVRVAGELPTAGLYKGMYVDRLDLAELHRWNGSAWEVVATPPTAYTPYVPVITGGGSATFSTLTGWYKYVGPPADKMVFFSVYAVVSAAGSGTTAIAVTSPTAPYRGTRQVVQGHIEGFATSPSLHLAQLVAFTGGSGLTWDRFRFDDPTNGVSNVEGVDLASGATIVIEGMYREA